MTDTKKLHTVKLKEKINIFAINIKIQHNETSKSIKNSIGRTE